MSLSAKLNTTSLEIPKSQLEVFERPFIKIDPPTDPTPDRKVDSNPQLTYNTVRVLLDEFRLNFQTDLKADACAKETCSILKDIKQILLDWPKQAKDLATTQ